MRLARWVAAASLGLAASAAAGPAAVDPLDKPWFTAAPAELLAASRAAHGDAPVIVLREDRQDVFDDHGRGVEYWRLVFVPRTRDAADSWQAIEQDWHSSYQHEPAVRARVIDPDGRVRQLDPATITDAPAGNGTELHKLSAQLPRLEIGSVVEQEVAITDHTASFAAGTIVRFVLGNSVPTLSTRVTYSAPARAGARVVTRGMPRGMRQHHEVRAGRETWSYAFDAVPALPANEDGVPLGDVFPNLSLTTARSWAAVARAYRRVVDARLAAGPIELPADLPRTPTLDTVTKISAWFDGAAGFTGSYLDQVGYVPRTPAETLQAGNGDDGDLATLLIAALRQAGVQADLVLLDTGAYAEPELPGLDLFDRALVRVRVDGQVIYLDPAIAAERPGQLPSISQGRYALVIADDTTGLVTTPIASPADNTIQEVRTFELADWGPSRVTEWSREGGAFEAPQRAWVRDHQADVQKQLASYVEQRYAADTLERYSTSAVDDLATPFEMTLVAAHAQRGSTQRETAHVYLYPRQVLERLPDVLGGNQDDQDATTPRTHDFVFQRPYVYEIENRIVFPDGFEVPAAARPIARDLGTMHLVEDQRVDGHTLVVRFRLDTGKLRLTPAEVEATRRAVADLREETVDISAQPTGWALVQRGRYREAVAEAQRVAAAHPKLAVQYSRLAEVLLEVGAGAAARRAARQAVALAPDDADTHVVLGWTLTHDTLGHRFGFDHDRAGAIKELERALVLDPKHVGGAAELGRLLAVSPHGRRFDPGADLAGAAAAWRTAYQLEQSSDHGLELARVLYVSGDAVGARLVLQELAADATRDPLLVAAAFAAGGITEARRIASSLETGAAENQLLTTAAGVALGARRYDDARALAAEGGGMTNPGVQHALDKLAVQPLPHLPSRDPRELGRALFVAMFDPDHPVTPFWDRATADEFYAHVRAHSAMLAQVDSLTLPVIDDLMLSMLQLHVEGDAAGWRLDGDTATGAHAISYVALDRGAAKIIGTTDTPAGVARHVLRLLARHDDEAAARCLDWLAKDLPGSSSKDAIRLFHELWGGPLPRDRRAMELAAVVLADGTVPAVRAIPVLARCGATTTLGQLACDVFLAHGYEQLRKWQNLADLAKDWQARAPKDFVPLAIATRARALARLGRGDDADRLLAGALMSDPGDAELERARVVVALARGRIDDALAVGARLVADPDATGADLNNIAWLQMIAGRDLPGALALARRAVAQPDSPHERLNTLAAIEAESGDLQAAEADSDRAMASAHDAPPADEDWYLAGRIDELLGLRDDAIAAYRHVKPAGPGEWLPSSATLAARRLKALGAR